MIEVQTPAGFLPERIYHFMDVPLAICPKCKCVTEHERLTDRDIEIDGYICSSCDGVTINDYLINPFEDF